MNCAACDKEMAQMLAPTILTCRNTQCPVRLVHGKPYACDTEAQRTGTIDMMRGGKYGHCEELGKKWYTVLDEPKACYHCQTDPDGEDLAKWKSECHDCAGRLIDAVLRELGINPITGEKA